MTNVDYALIQLLKHARDVELSEYNELYCENIGENDKLLLTNQYTEVKEKINGIIDKVLKEALDN